MVLDRYAADRNRPAADRLPPAKRGLGAKSLDDLRTIPWIFSWAQARINLAAWYGLGTACEKFGDLETMRQASRNGRCSPRSSTTSRMSIAKTDERIARMYLALGDREDLNEKVLNEMELTRKWVLAIVGDKLAAAAPSRAQPGHPASAPHTWTRCPSPRCWRSSRCARRWTKEELSQSQQAGFIYLILCTVSRCCCRPAEHGLIPGRPIGKSRRGGSVPIDGAGSPASRHPP